MSDHNSLSPICRQSSGRGAALLLAGLLSCAGLAHAAEAARVVFVAGAVHSGNTQLQLGNAIQEGDRIATGADGYVYLKTVDNGFLILRPGSQAQIVSYRIDQKHPENSRIKFELSHGVARSISGEGVKRSRQNFRFNTPVAAIGVRGTDFTVFTDQNTSRVAVVSGGVIVSPLAGSCLAEGSGPCEGAGSRELFANQQGQLLQIDKGQAVPRLMRGSAVAPDGAAPARADEPSAKAAGGNTGLTSADASVTVEKDAKLQKDIMAAGILPQPVIPPAIPPAAIAPVAVASQIVWGRWQAVLEQAANVDISKASDGSARLIALNNQFALLRQRSADWQVPHEGAAGFALQQSEAYILDEPRNLLSAAKIENGILNIDFAKASFSTSLDLVAQAERFHLQAKGALTSDGLMHGDSQFARPTNMNVTGVLGAEKSDAAAYLFQSRLDGTRTATGATYWTKATQ